MKIPVKLSYSFVKLMYIPSASPRSILLSKELVEVKPNNDFEYSIKSKNKLEIQTIKSRAEIYSKNKMLEKRP